MLNVHLNPLVGIKLDSIGEILLGDSKEKVKKLLASPIINKNSFYYYNSELRIDFDTNENVEFIQCLGGKSREFINPYIFNLEVFNTNINDLIEFIKNNIDSQLTCNSSYNYIFSNINVEFSKPSYSSSSKYFYSISIGVIGYFLKTKKN